MGYRERVCGGYTRTHVRLCTKCHFPNSSINLLNFCFEPQFWHSNFGQFRLSSFKRKGGCGTAWASGLQDRWKVLRAPSRGPPPLFQLSRLLWLSSSPNLNSPQIWICCGERVSQIFIPSPKSLVYAWNLGFGTQKLKIWLLCYLQFAGFPFPVPWSTKDGWPCCLMGREHGDYEGKVGQVSPSNFPW